jgi:heme oxygenase
MSRLTSLFSLLPGGTVLPVAKREVQPTTGRVDLPLRAHEDASTLSFSKRIRAGTAQAHRITESTQFVKSILRGAVDIESYRNMQTGLYVIYSAMEEELERHREHPLVRSVYFSALARCEALEQDLAFLWGEGWRKHLKITPARRQYLDRIRWVGENDPGLLVAHSYTRYMGDLSGGQVVERVVRRSLKIEGEEGFRFFHFDGIPEAKEFKNGYRRRLDSLPISRSQADAIIDEANRVFALNREIFEELEGSWLRALVRLVPTGFSQRPALSC